MTCATINKKQLETQTNMLRSASFKLLLIASPARNAFANPLSLLSARRRFSAAAVQSPRNFYLADARTKLLYAFDDEIKFNQMIPSKPAAPADFPFELKHARNLDLTLTRQIGGEEIQIAVLTTENQNGGGSSDSGDESPARSVPVRVVISKSNGKSMKFAATVSSNAVVVERVTIKDGEDNVICSQLYIEPESDLQMALRELLKTKGIEKSIGEFLYDYMSWKSKLPLSYTSSSRSIEASSAKESEKNVEILMKMKKVVEEW